MKINPVFKDKFVYDYFETFFKTGKRFPQSIVFEGLDTLCGYFFAIELARILNCEKTGEFDCGCTNCKWIRENKHPAVVNVTPLDFKEDNTKTVISVKQIEKITSIITETSDCHRFFIFSDAKNSPQNSFFEENLQKFKNAGYKINDEENYPYPLNKKILQEEASNALLKSTEEAPDKVTFVFLAQTKEDIISTINSRSLTFKIPAEYKPSNITVKEFFEDYPQIKIIDGMKYAALIQDKISKENIDIIDFFNSVEEYFLNLIKSNLNNAPLLSLINSDIKKAQTAKKQIKALVSPKNVLETFYISISNEGRNL